MKLLVIWGLSDESWNPWNKKFGGFWEGGKHWSEILGDDAVAFIDSVNVRNWS